MKKILICLVLILQAGCAQTVPKKTENLCHIFEQNPSWFFVAEGVEERWRVQPHILIAMMYQESSFRQDARPPEYLAFGITPWGRVSSAYSYAQAQDAVWSEYLRDAAYKQVERDDFEGASDFMGYYINKTTSINDVAIDDVQMQYLCYHEGGAVVAKVLTEKSLGWSKWLISCLNALKDTEFS